MAKISDLDQGPERDALAKQFGEDADVMEVAKMALNARQQLSSTRRVPGPDATSDERGSFYDHLGRPASAAEYQLPDAPDNLKPTLEKLRDVAYDKGLSQEQFAALATQAGAVSVEASSKVSEAKKAWEASVREKFGDKADQKLETAQHQLDQLMASDPEAQAIIKQSGLDKHPALVNLLLKVNNAMGEDTVPPVGTSQGTETGPTGLDLYKEGMEVMRSEAYKGGDRHPEGKLAQARITEILLGLQTMGFDGFRDARFHQKPEVRLPDGTRVI